VKYPHLSLYERLGGRPVLEEVHKIFYDKVYEHPWLGEFFADVEQKHIEAQQTDFMAGAFGGPKTFRGKATVSAHKHIYITKELFDLRHAVLRESIQEAGVPPDLMGEWLTMDSAFERIIVKKSESDCVRRYRSEEVVVIPRPPLNHKFKS
jgi:hemoglobin